MFQGCKQHIFVYKRTMMWSKIKFTNTKDQHRSFLTDSNLIRETTVEECRVFTLIPKDKWHNTVEPPERRRNLRKNQLYDKTK